MNEYTKDGMRWLSRASEIIPNPLASGDPDPDAEIVAAIEESILFFAIGIEKLLKGVLFGVNPLFVYEKTDVDNIAGVLYRRKMTLGMRAAFAQADKAKKISRHVHTGAAALHRAKYFCDAAHSNTGIIFELFELRGTVAHARNSDLKKNALAFVQKHFHPLVSAFADELGLDEDDIFAEGMNEHLARVSEQIVTKENFAAEMAKVESKHLQIWESRREDTSKVSLASSKTLVALGARFGLESFVEETACPVCQQQAVLMCGRDTDVVDGTVVVTGAFVNGLRCYYCDLEVEGYEQIDFFKLDQRLYDSD